MPAHITHSLFIKESIERAFGQEAKGLLDDYEAFLNLGAQGPDIFFHNRRSEPNGRKYGNMAHMGKYGKLCTEMIRHSMGLSGEKQEKALAYTYGFISHALLDRAAHPFINYFSGCFDTSVFECHRFRYAHPFYERLIDVVLLRDKAGLSTNEYDFFSRIDIGKTLPDFLKNLLYQSFTKTYRPASKDELLEQKIENAYLDARRYYNWSNLINRETLREAFKREREGDIGEAWLALIHPPRIPEGFDFMNQEHKEWLDPCKESLTYQDSFYDIYHKTLERCADVLRQGAKAVKNKIALNSLKQAIGNENLSDGRLVNRNCKKRYSDPFPLPDIIDSLHKELEKEYA